LKTRTDLPYPRFLAMLQVHPREEVRVHAGCRSAGGKISCWLKEEVVYELLKLDIGPLGRIIGDSSYGRFGLGMARGDERVERVVNEALSSPWFDYDLAETDAGIVIYSSSDPWDKEMESILGSLDSHLPRCRMICGSYADPALGERIRLSLILCRTL